MKFLLDPVVSNEAAEPTLRLHSKAFAIHEKQSRETVPSFGWLPQPVVVRNSPAATTQRVQFQPSLPA